MRLAWCLEPKTILTINVPASSPGANLDQSCKFCWKPNSESGSSLSPPAFPLQLYLLNSFVTSGNSRGAPGTKQGQFANNFTVASCRGECSPHRSRQPELRNHYTAVWEAPIDSCDRNISMAEAGKGGSRLNAEDSVQVQSCQDPWDSLTCWMISPTDTEPGVHTAAGQKQDSFHGSCAHSNVMLTSSR